MDNTKKSEVGKKVGLGFLETAIHIGVYVLIIFLFIRAATLAYDFSYHVFGDPVSSQYNTETVSFEVAEGTTMQQVSRQLASQDLIKYDLAFRIRAMLERVEDRLVPGTYELSQSMSEEEILTILTTMTAANAGTGDAVLGEDASGTIPEDDGEATDDAAEGGDGEGDAPEGE